jgi:xylan 1,4-beta-xylosidase
VNLSLNNLPFLNGARLTEYRIDADHSNSYEAWRKMGLPLPLSHKQYAKLEEAGQLAELEAKRIDVKNGAADLQFNLPRQAVSLLILEKP